MKGFAGIFLLLSGSWGAVVNKRATAHFDHGQTVGHVNSHTVREESGLCASRRHTNILYTHNDSGDSARFYALDASTGHVLATLTVEGATSHDWEDIACGPCVFGHSGWCVYIGDIGGNTGSGGENKIFMVREPPSIRTRSLQILETLRFTWDEHNAETLMVDPQGELYLISKVDGGRGKLYHIPKDAWVESSHRYHLTGGTGNAHP